MTNEIKNSFRHGISERIKEELPGLTKQAHEMVVDDIIHAVTSLPQVEAAAAIAGMEKEASGYNFIKHLGKKAGPVPAKGYSFNRNPTRTRTGSNTYRTVDQGVAAGPSKKGVGEVVRDKGITIGMGLLATTGLYNYLKSKKNAQLINQYADFQNTLANVAKRNEILAGENKARIDELGNSIFKFAPTVANDPLVLETVMSNAVHGGGLDPQTVRSLQELEERYHKLREVEAPKTFIL